MKLLTILVNKVVTKTSKVSDVFIYSQTNNATSRKRITAVVSAFVRYDVPLTRKKTCARCACFFPVPLENRSLFNIHGMK